MFHDCILYKVLKHFKLLSGQRKFASAMDILPHKVRVCVIGAGIAGLGASQRLIEAGVQDFVLLEAQDRIGGRVHTVRHGGYL